MRRTFTPAFKPDTEFETWERRERSVFESVAHSFQTLIESLRLSPLTDFFITLTASLLLEFCLVGET